MRSIGQFTECALPLRYSLAVLGRPWGAECSRLDWPMNSLRKRWSVVGPLAPALDEKRRATPLAGCGLRSLPPWGLRAACARCGSWAGRGRRHLLACAGRSRSSSPAAPPACAGAGRGQGSDWSERQQTARAVCALSRQPRASPARQSALRARARAAPSGRAWGRRPAPRQQGVGFGVGQRIRWRRRACQQGLGWPRLRGL